MKSLVRGTSALFFAAAILFATTLLWWTFDWQYTCRGMESIRNPCTRPHRLNEWKPDTGYSWAPGNVDAIRALMKPPKIPRRRIGN